MVQDHVISGEGLEHTPGRASQGTWSSSSLHEDASERKTLNVSKKHKYPLLYRDSGYKPNIQEWTNKANSIKMLSSTKNSTLKFSQKQETVHVKLEKHVETKDNEVPVWKRKKSPEMDSVHIISE